MSFSIAIHELAPITPLALPHQYLLLKKWDEEIDPRILDQHKGKKIPKDLKLSYGFYLVHAVKEIRPFIKDFGALSAWPNGKKTDQELTELKLEASGGSKSAELHNAGHLPISKPQRNRKTRRDNRLHIRRTRRSLNASKSRCMESINSGRRHESNTGLRLPIQGHEGGLRATRL